MPPITLNGTSGITTPAIDAAAGNSALTTLSVGGNNISSVNSLGFRNRIINGDMRIDQRNAGASVSIAGSTYAVDRWEAAEGLATGSLSGQQVSDAPSGFINSLKFTTTAAGAAGAAENTYVRQFIEGYNSADLAWGTSSAVTITLSFWIKSSLTGTFSGGLFNAGADRSYVFTYSISAANTWEQKTITIAGDQSGTWNTTNGRGIGVVFDLGSGSNQTGSAGSWTASLKWKATGSVSLIGTLNATWQITGVQLEAGNVASPFERRDYGRELMMCQRYYQQIGGTADATIGSGLSTSTSAAAFYVKYPVTMRSAPAVSGTSFNVTDGLNYNAAVSSLGTVNAGVDSARVFVNTSAVMTQYRPALLQPIGSTSFLALSSEL